MPTDPANLSEALAACRRSAGADGLALPEDQLALLDHYRQLLWDFNEQLNLTRHTTFEKFATRDVLDTMELAKLIAPKRRVLDVGSGGGVPGVILAIIRPDLRIALAESTQKKARVLQQMAGELALPVEVFAVRAEELLELRTFDTLTARAVAPLHKLLTWLAPHWKAFDELLLIKGAAWVEERAEARHRGLLKKLELRKAATYPTPGLDNDSVILRITLRTKDHDDD